MNFPTPSTVLSSEQLEVRAQQALHLFGLPDAALTPLGQSDTTVYRVGGLDDHHYVLRLHTSHAQDSRALQAEACWLDHLWLVVPDVFPRPIRSQAGHWVEAVGERPEASPVWATLLTWLDGEPLSAPFTPEQAKDAGQLIAQLHLHAEQAESFANLDRPTYDLTYFDRSWQALQRTLGIARVTPDQVAVVEAAWPVLQDLLDPIEAVPGGYGLIHGDAHPGNFVVQREQLRLIDFGRLGWGPYLLDIAHSALDMESAQRAAFLDGYTLLRPLPTTRDLHFRALLSLAALDNLAFLAERPHELDFVLDALPSVIGAIARLTADVTTPPQTWSDQ
ncbi:hypothetical protein E7T06_17615 [Deinococcus sp. Arct2-2]|uniref:phosphotransferase enzyme family protein n=1 Tax=Deinococcus sp. Arct2-2 TaxID=2568653 RepID=UPI0010A53501|nr:phosphotransferase [Deinococcus sp. Arct2-2]THF68155.1 hypothetical protein E7T06_17615 [Deinococcus sp. Arct2-2]